MEQVFLKTHCCFEVFSSEKHFFLWDYPNLSYHVVLHFQ